MGEESKPVGWLGPFPAGIISVAVAGLLGLSAGAKVDDLVRPMLGPAGAMVAGLATAAAAFLLIVVLSYRGLTR